MCLGMLQKPKSNLRTALFFVCGGLALALGVALVWPDSRSVQPAAEATTAAQTAEQLEARLSDSKFIHQGQVFFERACARCHGLRAEGGTGPNLTDEYWIYGRGDLTSIVAMIQVGSPSKGMPAWEAMSDQIEIEAAAVYIATLKNSNPPNAKAPQGSKR